MATLEINDILTDLRLENDRLSQQLLFANTCLTFLERYRNSLIAICGKCGCDAINDEKLSFNRLENEYETVVNRLINRRTDETIINPIRVKREFDDNDVSGGDSQSADGIEHSITSVISDINDSTEDYSMNDGSDLTEDNSNNHYQTNESTIDVELSEQKPIPKKKRIRYSPVSNEIRKLIVKACDEGENVRNVAKIFQMKYNTVRTIFKVWQNEGRIDKKPIGHRPRILSDEQEEQVRKWYDENCCLTLRQTKQKCIEAFGKSMSITTVERMLGDLHFTFKLMTPNLEILNDNDSISQRYNYALNYNTMLAKKQKMFFIEDIGVTLYTRASRGSGSLKGSKSCKSIRSRNYALKCALNYDTIYLFEIEYKSNDTFGDFLEKLLQRFDENKPNRIENAFIIMDSLKLSDKSEIADIIRSRGHQPVFLPPNSPFLDVIQCVYSEWISFVKQSKPKDENQLYSVVINSTEKFKAQHSKYSFKDMEKSISKCLKKEAIVCEL